MPGSGKRSYVEVCLSMYDLSLPPGIKGLVQIQQHGVDYLI